MKGRVTVDGNPDIYPLMFLTSKDISGYNYYNKFRQILGDMVEEDISRAALFSYVFAVSGW